MLLRNITQQQIFSLIKLIAAIIIFYACLSYAILPVGEDFSELIQKDYLSTNGIQELDAEAVALSTGQGHFAAGTEVQYQKKYMTICASNTDLCDVIRRVGEYTRQEKYLYLSSIFSVVNFVQGYKLIGNDMVSVLREITVDNSLGDRRGYATWNEIVFNLGSVQSRSEFVGLAAHELGHVYDLGALQGVHANKHGAFTEFGKKVFAIDDLSLKYYANSWKSEKIRKPASSKKDFCSGYGMSDPFEDFAECFNLYVNHNALFKTMAKRNEILKKKYNYVASVFDGNFLHGNEGEAKYVKDNAGRRPWDTTRISQ